MTESGTLIGEKIYTYKSYILLKSVSDANFHLMKKSTI